MKPKSDLKLVPKGELLSEEELYKKMYYHLFNAVIDAIRSQTKAESDVILKNAQIETEEIYISMGE